MKCVVFNEQVQHKYSVMDILHMMTHHDLRVYRKKGSKEMHHVQEGYEQSLKNAPYQKGIVFVSPTKEDLTQGKGYIITSYEMLADRYQHVTHWTPNTYRGGTYYDFKRRIIKGHERTNLKQVHVFGMDIDSKEIDLYGLYMGCEEQGLPRPNLLLETPRGYQLFFILDTPFYIHHQQNYKSLRIAERISENMRQALKEYAPIDTACVPFGFYRMPKEDNIIDFYPEATSTKALIQWSVNYEKKQKKAQFHVIYPEQTSHSLIIESDWYRGLIQSRNIDKGYTAASRNNAIMTLALANYASGRKYEVAYDELDQFNSNLVKPLSHHEFQRILNSAYSGKYQGPKRSYVEGLLELWTRGVQYEGREGWYKFKKPREERVRSHYHEWEEDIVEILEERTSPEKPFLTGSLKELANLFGLALSSLKELIKKSRKIVKRTVGKGRAAYTQITTQSMLMNHILLLRKNNKKQENYFDELAPYITIAKPSIQLLQKEKWLKEVESLDLSGASPPELIS